MYSEQAPHADDPVGHDSAGARRTPHRLAAPRADAIVSGETLLWTSATSADASLRLRHHPGLDDATVERCEPDLELARRALDAVNDGIVITSADGAIGYRNAAATRLLDDGDPCLARAIAAAAAAVLSSGCASVREAESDGRWFELRPMAFVTSHGLPRALVVITCTSSTVPSVGHIAHRHGLTLREAAVGRLLAEGHRNDVIAQRLSIRETTARHYPERVLMKLGTRSRGEAAAIILGTKAVRANQAVLARPGA
jgi:DNA-binding NarL/FixJ family response regulator